MNGGAGDGWVYILKDSEISDEKEKRLFAITGEQLKVLTKVRPQKSKKSIYLDPKRDVSKNREGWHLRFYFKTKEEQKEVSKYLDLFNILYNPQLARELDDGRVIYITTIAPEVFPVINYLFEPRSKTQKLFQLKPEYLRRLSSFEEKASRSLQREQISEAPVDRAASGASFTPGHSGQRQHLEDYQIKQLLEDLESMQLTGNKEEKEEKKKGTFTP